MLYIGNTRYRVYSGGDRVSIESPEKQDLVIKNTLLPSGLELYDYIESSGTQYIDTEYIPTNFTKVILDFKNNVTNDGFFFGGRDEYNGTSCFCLHKDFAQFGNDMGSGYSISTSTSRNLIALSQEGIYINNILKHTYANKTFTSPKTLKLFAMEQSAGMYSTKSSISVYMFKVYDNNTLIRDFVPAKYNGEPGMWDIVENKFYGNEGSGEFTLGNKVVLKEYEYLQGVQGAYIDTGIDNNSNSLRMDLNFRPIQTTGNRYYTGNYANNDGQYFEYISGSDGWQWAWRCAYKQITRTPNTSLPETHSFYVENGTSIFLINGNIIQSNTQNKDGGRIYIGGSKISSSNTIATYWCKITNNGQLIKDFIPCSYNGIPGIWDKIELKFYESSNNGTFVVGNEIKCYDYLENDGVAYIDTGIIGGNNISTELKFRNIGSANRFIYGGTGNYTPVIVQSNNWFNTRYSNVGDSNVTTIVLTQVDQNDHIIRFNFNNSILWDGVEYASNLSIKNDTKTLYLFNSSDILYTATARIYYCKIYNNGTLVRDYEPCLYNKQAGLWDTVERKFYGNANNTGVLTIGNNS